MNPKPVTDPGLFMAWAMENKLKLTASARARITRAVTVLFMKGEINRDEYEKYICLTKRSAD